MKKKWFALLLAIVLTFSFLTACSKEKPESVDKTQETEQKEDDSKEQEEEKEEEEPEETVDYGDTGGLELPLVDEPVTITWMVVSSLTDANDKPVIKEIEERTGIKVDVMAVPKASYAEKLKITLGSGKLPDIVHGLSLAEANKMGAQGALTPINEYIDDLPNFKKLYVEENPWVMKSWSDDKGDLYTWPVYGVSRDVNHGFLYRKDIFDKHDIPLWEDTEGFYQALKKLKEEYPDSLPYSSKTKEYIFRDWGYGWGVSSSEYPMYYDKEENAWKYMFAQPEFKDMIDFMKKLYDEGLLDSEFLTDTEASWTAKMTSENKSFVTYDWIGRMDMFYDQVKDQIPEYDLRYANPIGPVGKIRRLNKVQNWGHIVPKNKNNEVALKLLDYLSSPSGSALITLGIEDEHYVFDSDGNVEYPNLDADKVEITVLENEYGCWLEGMYMRVHPQSAYFNYTEKEQEAQDMMIEGDKIGDLDTILKFTDEETETIAELREQLLKSGIEFASKYILGDADWDEWVKKAEGLEAGKLEDIYNEAQKRFDAAE